MTSLRKRSADEVTTLLRPHLDRSFSLFSPPVSLLRNRLLTLPRSASLLPSELLRNIFLHELSEEAGYDWWAEANGRHFSLVCRDWAGPGQELAFYRPTLRGYYPKDPIALFAKHLERFPHIAKLVRDLRLNFSTNKPANADAVRSILQRCNRITQIRWLSNLDLLTADPHVLPLAKLTDVRLGGSKQRCDISALLGTLPHCASLRSLSLSLALPGDSPLSFNAAVSESLPLKTLRLQTDNGSDSAASSEACLLPTRPPSRLPRSADNPVTHAAREQL